MGSLFRSYSDSESASKCLTRLGTVKSIWLWGKRRWEQIGIILNGFATLSGMRYIPLSQVKGVSRAGFPFYFLSVVEFTSFHQPGHTTKCFSLSSFLLEHNLLTTLLTTRQAALLPKLYDIYSETWVNPDPSSPPLPSPPPQMLTQNGLIGHVTSWYKTGFTRVIKMTVCVA